MSSTEDTGFWGWVKTNWNEVVDRWSIILAGICIAIAGFTPELDLQTAAISVVIPMGALLIVGMFALFGILTGYLTSSNFRLVAIEFGPSKYLYAVSARFLLTLVVLLVWCAVAVFGEFTVHLWYLAVIGEAALWLGTAIAFRENWSVVALIVEIAKATFTIDEVLEANHKDKGAKTHHNGG